MSDGLGLHGRVDADPLQTGGLHGAALQPGLDGGSQQLLQPVWSQPLAPARQRTGIARQLMLEIFAAAEPLPVRVLGPALHHGFVGQVEGVLEIGQPDHQPCRLRGPSEGSVEAAKLPIEAVPVDESGEPIQLMTVVEDLIETAAVEIAGARHRRLGSHRKTPGLSGSVPRCRHSTMLHKDKESFSLNQLWVVQDRLGIAPSHPQGRKGSLASPRYGDSPSSVKPALSTT